MQCNETIGDRIGKLITKTEECTQQKLADGCGVKRETVVQWLNGTRKIKAEHIIALCDFFNVSADYLLCRSNVESRDIDLQSVCAYSGLSEAAIEKLHSVYFDEQSKGFISSLITEYGETYHDIYSYTSGAIDSLVLAEKSSDDKKIWLTNHLASRGIKTKDAPVLDGTEIISARQAFDFKISAAAQCFRDFIKSFVEESARGK